MAAIPIELAIVGLGAAGSIAIPAAATGIAAAVARSKMKPSKIKVSTVDELREGDHISYKIGKLSTRHAIVVGFTKDARPKLAFVRGEYGEANVNCEDVDLGPHMSTLYRRAYNPLITYVGEEVAERARSLTDEFNSAERHSTIHNYWKFFKDDEHFALWCHTGTYFGAVMRGMMSSDYKFTIVQHFSSLREGDHICYRVGGPGCYEHAIVIEIDVENQMATVVLFTGKRNDVPSQTCLGVDVYIRKGHLYRYDYDLAVGDDSDTVISTALNEIGRTSANASGNYKTSEEFAVWCKTAFVCSPNDASTLTTARLLAQICTPVPSKQMLKVGDHIAYNSGKLYYYQHGMIVGISDTKVDVVFLPGNVAISGKLMITKETVDMSEYIHKKQLYKYFYDTAEWNNAKMVVARAEEQIGALVLERPFKDPLHFAVWCKTGNYQLHRRTGIIELEY